MANIKRANTSGITKTGTAISDVPDAPTIGVATNVGTSRAYNNGAATVAYTAAATGGAVVTFTATSTPGSFTATGASPITVTGLQSGTAYTFTVSGTNSISTSISGTSGSITATTVPQAPTIGAVADASATSATVAFTANETGGSAITGFTATSTPGSITGTGASSPITVSGLTTGTAYTFTVTATNANGTSTASSASGSVSPAARTLYTFGGWNGGYYSTMYKFNTADDSRSTLAATLTTGGYGHNEMSNWGSASYLCGGGTSFGSSVGAISTIQKLLFSNDARSNITATLATARGRGSSMTNSGTKGYMSNGQNATGGSLTSTETVIYSN